MNRAPGLKVAAVNENSLLITVGKQGDATLSQTIKVLVARLKSQLDKELLDIVAAYTTVLVCIDVRIIALRAAEQKIAALLASLPENPAKNSDHHCIEIPVYYGPEVALDADAVASHCGLDFETVCDIHSKGCYQVYAIGFAPGFAYLGDTAPQLSTPRMATPRLKVPAGAVAIAEQQTAVYPSELPGGWHIIGKTPLNIIDFSLPNLSPFETGAQVRFKTIDRKTFLALGGALNKPGEYA